MKALDFITTHKGISPGKNVVTRRSYLVTPKVFRATDYDHETRHVKNMIRILRERVMNLEVQLLECYGRKEQQAAIMELKNRLKISNMEAKFLILKIDSLQADNQRLQEQIDDHKNICAELDAATLKIKFLKKKLSSQAEQNKEQISTLQKRVAELQDEELVAASNSNIHLHLQTLERLEDEAEKLRKSNLKLQLENTELASKLEATQILANSVLEHPETEALRELSEHLRQENEDLANEIAQLQADRCSDAEDLVYLRWVNACLRYELRNFQPPQGKTVARDLSRSLSPESEKKAKQLILEYASSEGLREKGISVTDYESDHWLSSQISYIIDSGEYGGFSASSKVHSSHRNKFFSKLRRLVLGKDHGSKAEKPGRLEDSDSPNDGSSVSTGSDTLSDLPSNRFQTLSLHLPGNSSRYSIDLQRLQTPNSDTGSFHSHRRLSSCDSSQDHMDHDSYSTEKSELMKFAEVLKETNSLTEETSSIGRSHRKSESFGSLNAIHSSFRQ
ncbi:hypothetical protein K2173_024774 [Erythroxylum novogranatense]|uniref:Uncharacterized protein n=1 Tax=Erythroxylum novogranatense TaxID=1862640 RepID=A0AAV8SVD8_9ROSI|nr:hypothetical protein K2173_024774 [Erythroxylum novogranatense]